MGSTSYLNEYRSLLTLILDLEDKIEESEYVISLVNKAKTEEPELGINALSKDASEAIDAAIHYLVRDYYFSTPEELDCIVATLGARIPVYRLVLNDLYDRIADPLRLVLANEDIDVVDKCGSPTWLRNHLDSQKCADANRRRASYRKQLYPTNFEINPIRLEAHFKESDDNSRAAFLT